MPIDPNIVRFPENASIETLLERNRDWSRRISALRPTLFPTLKQTQTPQVLWLGCSDSRIPETTLLDLFPGEVFVHRNIANVLPPTDLSSLSVIQYAVEVLKVKHVIVCGHTGCGGVKASLGNDKLGLIDVWLKNIREVRARHRAELEAIKDIDERVTRLAELNVVAQVEHLKENSNVLEAIKNRGLQVHGLLYDIGTGLLRNVAIDSKENPETFLLH